jgi:orotidine-5'-phosphate decarboxylase
MHFSDTLIKQIRAKKSVVCVGLDPRLEKIPAKIRAAAQERFPDDVLQAAGEALFRFNCGIIDAVADICPIVKPQIAFYEMFGAAGMKAFADTLLYARSKGLLTIADAKRNDIGTTAEAYANAYLGSSEVFGEKVSAFAADSITVTPYLGWDGIKPFIEVASKNGKGVFVLVKTSNKSSSDFQDLEVSVGEGQGKPFYETVGHFVESWGADEIGSEGYSSVGAVVGATYPQQAKKLRELMPETIFLVPGFGAQGGTVEDVKPCFNPGGMGAIINSSRDVIFAYESSDKFGEDDYAAAARAKVLEMNEQLSAIFEE